MPAIPGDLAHCDNSLTGSKADPALSQPRLGFVSSRAMNVTDSGVWTEPGTGRMLDLLRRAFPNTTIALSDHGPNPLFFNTYRTSFSECDVIRLPKMVSLPKGLLRRRKCAEVLRMVEERSDILMVQLPFDSPFALIRQRRPTLYHICADLRSVARSSRFRGPMRIAAGVAASLIDRLYTRLLNSDQARVFANGEELYKKYGTPKGRWFVSAVISNKEIASVKRNRPQNAPFRVLYVGYLRKWKGIDILLEAFRTLLKRVPLAELHIIGQPDPGEQATATELQAQAQDLIDRSLVRFLDHVPFGPALFQCFADADVLALPSRGVEGTPRVLVEARAFGCPVIATDVGGVRSSVTDRVDGLIIPPGDLEALETALLELATIKHASQSH